MEGVTTAIVAFLFVCIVFPSVIKVRPQYYAALAIVLLIIFLQSVAALAGNPGFTRVTFGLIGLLQVGAILMLILGAGGLSARTLADDAIRSFEVIRRGEHEKEIIIKPANAPLGGGAPKTAAPVAAAPAAAPPRPPVRNPAASQSIPLEE